MKLVLNGGNTKTTVPVDMEVCLFKTSITGDDVLLGTFVEEEYRFYDGCGGYMDFGLVTGWVSTEELTGSFEA